MNGETRRPRRLHGLGLFVAAGATLVAAGGGIRDSLAHSGARSGPHSSPRSGAAGTAAYTSAASAGAGAEITPEASVDLGQTRVLPWPTDMVWPTAVRLLRVDRGYTIVDRDPDAGYILFDFPVGTDAKGRGSVEVFATTDASGRSAASVQITTDGGPVHLPHTLLDALAQKLREERGPPASPPPRDPPKKPPAKPTPPDGGQGDPDEPGPGKPKKPTQRPPVSPEDPLVIDPEDLPILE